MLDGWNIISGDFSVQDNILTLKTERAKRWLTATTTWDDYVIQAKVKLDVRQDVKSNAGYIFRCSDFDVDRTTSTVMFPASTTMQGQQPAKKPAAWKLATSNMAGAPL